MCHPAESRCEVNGLKNKTLLFIRSFVIASWKCVIFVLEQVGPLLDGKRPGYSTAIYGMLGQHEAKQEALKFYPINLLCVAFNLEAMCERLMRVSTPALGHSPYGCECVCVISAFGHLSKRKIVGGNITLIIGYAIAAAGRVGYTHWGIWLRRIRYLT